MSSLYRDQDRSEATYLRAALLIGIIRGGEAIRWADRIIERDTEPSAAVIELSLTPADDLSSLRHALFALAHPTESPEIVRRLITVIATDFVNGKRDVEDTLRVLHQLRRLVLVPDEFKEEMATVEKLHMLAKSGVEGRLERAETKLREWLQQFATQGAGH